MQTGMTNVVVTSCTFADTSKNLLHKSLAQTGMVVFNKFSYSVTYCSVTQCMIVMAACYYKKCGQCLKRGRKTMRFKKQALVAIHTAGNTWERILPWTWCENLPEQYSQL